MTTTPNLENIRAGVLNRMERHSRNVKLAIGAAALVELLLMVVAATKLQFSNRFEVLVFVFFVLTYSIISIGMVALGVHVSRVGERVLLALADRGR